MTEKITMAKKEKRPPKTWMLPTPTQRTAKAPVPERIKADLDAKAIKLVDGVLKPKHVKTPPKEPRFNYIVDVWIKWLGSTLYFGATYACPGPTAISTSFESKFARMEHNGGGRFALSYMRHTDKWFRLAPSLSVDECLDAIENGWHFQLKFYVDGVVVRTVENTHWHQPLILIFDSETMPDWMGMPKDEDLPATFSVEYVRAWKKQ